MAAARKILPVLGYCSLLLLAGLGFKAAGSAYDPPRGAYICDGAIELAHPDGTVNEEILPWYTGGTIHPAFSPGGYSIRLELALPPEALDGRELVLVFPNLSCTAMRVSVNGIYAGSQGDWAGGRSTIWNSAKVFPFPPGSASAENEITLDLLGVYSAGVNKLPYALDRGASAAHVAKLSFLGDSLLWLIGGGIAIIGFYVLVMGLYSRPLRNARVFLGLSALCTALFMADFLTVEFLPVSLLVFKRGVVVLRHVAAAFFVLGYLKLLERKPDWFARLFLAVQAPIIAALFVPGTVIGLKSLYTYTYLSFLPFQAYLLVLLFLDRRRGVGRFLLLSGVGVGLLASGFDIVAAFSDPGAVLVSHYGFAFLVLCTVGFIVHDTLQSYRMLAAEQALARRYREESLHDPLTGAFNRAFLPLVRDGVHGDFSVILCDLDRFKDVNDRYGHDAGDRVLVDAVGVMNRVFRHGDYIVRIGGDEFAAIMPGCPERKAEEILARLKDEIRQSKVACEGGSVISYSVSAGAAWRSVFKGTAGGELDAALRQADARMYKDKKAGTS